MHNSIQNATKLVALNISFLSNIIARNPTRIHRHTHSLEHFPSPQPGRRSIIGMKYWPPTPVDTTPTEAHFIPKSDPLAPSQSQRPLHPTAPFSLLKTNHIQLF